MTEVIRKISLIYIFMSLYICISAANLTINTTNQRLAISPYIYGLNQQLNGDENITVMRLGGNRMTGYNWENNASNAGQDWYDSSDDFMCGAYNVSATDCANKSGAVYEAFVDYNLAHNYDSLVTIPMAGYVAADKNGDVTAAQTAPSSRWHPIFYSKGSAFAYPPNTADDAVYMDESVWHLTQDYGLAGSATGVKFYMLDNEPGIWNSTHPYLHPLTPTCVEYASDSTNLGKAIKNVDPNSLVFGGVFYGWSDYMTLNGAPDWAAQGTGYNWFVSYYLKKMKDAETANGGKRILDVIDFHYYSEATNGTCRITDNNCAGYPTNANTERMNATRTLYDAAYRENSWIGQWYPQFIPLIPLIISSINTYYPGTKFSFSEWNFGAGKYISGGLADVDTLGIFGKYGAYLATMWSVDEGGYSSSAFKMYRNYDGSNSTFGNTSVEADTDTNTMTVYASINGSDVSQLHLIVVNKFPTTQTANITITSPEAYSSMQVYGFDQTSYTITARSSVAIAANSFAYSMPAYSTMHFILSSNVTPTNTPNWTATPTYTRTQTFTITPTFTSTPIAASVIIYDGDTAGATIADGTVNSTAPGVMSQTTGGDPGNMMKLTYTTVTGWWEQHSWVLNNPKSTSGEMYLTFNVRQDPSSANAVVQFDVGLNTGWSINLDVSNYLVGGGAVTTAWKTVMIPLSALLDAGQTTVNYIAFTDNYTNDYTVDIDNVMLIPAVATPTPTTQYSSTYTQTYTGTYTPTSSVTRTFTPTFTATYSYTQTFTQTLFVTATVTPSITATITGTPPTVTDTPTITWTYTFTATVTMTATPTITWTLQPTKSFTPTLTATPTFTQTFTWTITPNATFTFTPTLPATPTFTPTVSATTSQSGIKVVIYPDPIIAGKDPLKMLISSDQKPVFVKLRIYTASFRLIHEATWDSSGITGSYVVTEGADKFANLGSGSYYFVVFVTDQQGRVTRSKASPLIILR